MSDTEIAIIGAGPYGLSIAAFLSFHGKDFRIFGHPMHTWATQMPQGMHLKSEGFASSLFDPEGAFPLSRYCSDMHMPYADIGMPVPLRTFIDYGLEFQKKMVPNLQKVNVVRLETCSEGFALTLETGERVRARKVVVAVGISHYSYLPPVLAAMPKDAVSHTSDHSSLAKFKGCDVMVIGGGSSAVDMAALLHDAGASVQLAARKPAISFHNPPGRQPRPWRDRLRAPMTGLGPGWRSLFCTKGPRAFRHFPEDFRLEVVRRHLGPAPGWFMRERVAGKFPMHLGHALSYAEMNNGSVKVTFSKQGGGTTTIAASHVIGGTGYRVDLRRLAFLPPALRDRISAVEHTPRLSSMFESSVPGLYFTGASSANTFGPLVRFAYGAGFTARRLSRHLIKAKATIRVSQSALANAS